jgi:PilZ domain-containing protein
MLERRKYPRSHVLRRGNIVFRNGHSAVGCIVLDVSSGGARLKVRDWMGLPDVFELRIENGPARQVEVRYRDLETTGVQFADAA